MKKAVTLALTLFIVMCIPIEPICSHAAGDIADPICGLWPLYIEKDKTLPSIWSAFNFNCDKILMLMDIRESGEVFLYDILFSDGIGDMESEILGAWEKNDDRYTVRMIGSERTLEAYMEGDALCIALWDEGLYSRLSKLESFDWFKDLIR